MTLHVTILGCGSSGGVPQVDGSWGDCDPDNPKNLRQRCSLLVRRRAGEGETCVLIDTSPDLRQQLLAAGAPRVDAVLYTHAHADHTHGIDDLRFIAYANRRRMPVYADAVTRGLLEDRFAYCFKQKPNSDYPPILQAHTLTPYEPIRIEGAGGVIEATPFVQHHGRIDSMGYRFGPFAYSADVKALPDASWKLLEGLDLWIVDALRRKAHPTHFNLDDALRAIARARPKRAILSNLHSDMDYETLRTELADNIEPAFDGMTVTVEEPALSSAGS